MPLVNEDLKAQNTDTFDQSFKSNQQANAFQQTEPNQKGLITVPPALMQIIPWIPFALEAMTGQKIPQIGGTIGEIQNSLSQIQFSLSQIHQNQQQLWNKLESLEQNASQQLTNLKEQMISTNNNFRLLATETKRSLEFSRQPQLENETN